MWNLLKLLLLKLRSIIKFYLYIVAFCRVCPTSLHPLGYEGNLQVINKCKGLLSQNEALSQILAIQSVF